jgi:hypothetical protein
MVLNTDVGDGQNKMQMRHGKVFRRVLTMTRITRIEVIDENGRSYVNWEEENDVSWQLQDEGRTLKVFVDKRYTND